MALFAGVYAPSSVEDVSATVGATTSSAEIVIGREIQFAITATGNFNIAFGNAGMAAATATNFQISGGGVATYYTGSHSDRIRIFNPGGGTITYWITLLKNS